MWILFAVNFAIKIVIKKEMAPAMMIVPIMYDKFVNVSSGISFDIATAAPVLVF